MLLGAMTNCPACGSSDIHRSRSATLAERSQKLFSHERPHRCHACGWRGWGRPTAHRHAAVATSDGWQAVEMDLAQLDGETAARSGRRQAGSASEPAARPSKRGRSHRHRSSRQPGRVNSTEFNRRLQLVLFVTLLLVGIVVVMRACSSAPSRSEPDIGMARMEN